MLEIASEGIARLSLRVPCQNAGMAWQMLVIVAQLGIGAGLLLGGLRRAVHYGLAFHNKDHAERLARQISDPNLAAAKP